MLLVFAFACATFVAGVTLAVRGAVGVTPPLASVAEDLHRPRFAGSATVSLLDRALLRLSGAPSVQRSADLAV